MRIVLFLLLFLSSNVMATITGSQLIFINGIATSPMENVENARALENALREDIPSLRNGHVIPFYNRSRGFFADVIETDELNDAASEMGVSPIDLIVSISFGFLDPDDDNLRNIIDTAFRSFNGEISLPISAESNIQGITNLINSGITYNWNFDGLKGSTTFIGRDQSRYTPWLLTGHSEGTLFVNEIYNRLLFHPVYGNEVTFKCSKTNLVGAVTPRVENGFYVTSTTDYIVRLYDLVANVLDANVMGTFDMSAIRASLGHNFIGAYLTQPDLKDQILANASELAGQMGEMCVQPIPPPKQCPNAVIERSPANSGAGDYRYTYTLPDDNMRTLDIAWEHYAGAETFSLLDASGVTRFTTGQVTGQDTTSIMWDTMDWGRRVTVNMRNHFGTFSSWDFCVSCDDALINCAANPIIGSGESSPPPSPPPTREVFISVSVPRPAIASGQTGAWHCPQGSLIPTVDGVPLNVPVSFGARATTLTRANHQFGLSGTCTCSQGLGLTNRCTGTGPNIGIHYTSPNHSPVHTIYVGASGADFPYTIN